MASRSFDQSIGESLVKAVFLTAGAAGMFCGSCMHDNSLARAMIARGVDCLLQPVYTPIRTDDISVASDQVFFGGIHIFLLQKLPWLRFVPERIRRTLDWEPLLRWATNQAHSTDAGQLGELTVSMLRGTHGHQAGEVRRLAHWLAHDIRPDAVLLSNLLIGGSLPTIRESLPDARLAVMLQGDDLFFDFLPEKNRNQAIELCQGLVAHVDRFIVHSQFYAKKMGELLEIPDEKIVVTPLSIDTAPFETVTHAIPKSDNEFRLGYMARVSPEKGFHHLIDAFVHLSSDPEHHDLTLHAAGWLGEDNKPYLSQQLAKITSASVEDRFTYHGSPTLNDKIAFLRSLDLLCVPTDYHDPKGLFVLEALAAGVPVLQPDHGAFGELILSTGGGQVYRPGDPIELVRAIGDIKRKADDRRCWADAGHAAVHANHSIQRAAENLQSILFD